MPFFSVIIPNYNHAPFLRQRVESVLDQTFADFEIIFLDDRSTDNSIEVLTEFKSNEKVSHFVINEKNSGTLTNQWKKGIELAKGNWIWIAESDDLADPHFLEDFFTMINTHPTAGLFYCDSFIADQALEKITGNFANRKNSLFSTQKWSMPYSQKGVDEINECLKYDSTINNMSAVVFKKEIAEKILQTIQPFQYYADWYFYLHLCLLTNICYTPRTLSTYRLHSGSLLNATTSIIISKKEYFEILKLLYYSHSVTNKKKLLTHFSFNYLSFGLKEDGLRKGLLIVKNYFRSDKQLALRITKELILIKLFYKKYKSKFELKEDTTTLNIY